MVNLLRVWLELLNADLFIPIDLIIVDNEEVLNNISKTV